MDRFLSDWLVAHVASTEMRDASRVAAGVFDNRRALIILRPVFIFWRFFDARLALPLLI
jgi:hypothetical protein